MKSFAAISGMAIDEDVESTDTDVSETRIDSDVSESELDERLSTSREKECEQPQAKMEVDPQLEASAMQPAQPQTVPTPQPLILPDWWSDNWGDLIPVSKVDRDFDYTEVTEAASKLRPIRRKEVPDVQYEGDDGVYLSWKRRRISAEYAPNERYHDKINDWLARYKNDISRVNMGLTIPVDLTVFPEGKIRANPPIPNPDSSGKYPRATDPIVAFQGEIVRLDALMRGMLKIHENDSLVINTLQTRLDAMESELERRSYAEGKPYHDSETIKVMRAASKNFCSREELLAEAEAMITVIRRRDNAVRTFGQEGLAEHVSRPMCPYSPSGEKLEEPIEVLYLPQMGQSWYPPGAVASTSSAGTSAQGASSSSAGKT
jgi:hypothetical protein